MTTGQKGGQELGRAGQELVFVGGRGHKAEVNADTAWRDRASCHLSMSDEHVLWFAPNQVAQEADQLGLRASYLQACRD